MTPMAAPSRDRGRSTASRPRPRPACFRTYRSMPKSVSPGSPSAACGSPRSSFERPPSPLRSSSPHAACAKSRSARHIRKTSRPVPWSRRSASSCCSPASSKWQPPRGGRHRPPPAFSSGLLSLLLRRRLGGLFRFRRLRRRVLQYRLRVLVVTELHLGALLERRDGVLCRLERDGHRDRLAGGDRPRFLAGIHLHLAFLHPHDDRGIVRERPHRE